MERYFLNISASNILKVKTYVVQSYLVVSIKTSQTDVQYPTDDSFWRLGRFTYFAGKHTFLTRRDWGWLNDGNVRPFESMP